MQLMLKRVHGDKSSPATKAQEIYDFFSKYERILGSEISQLSTL